MAALGSWEPSTFSEVLLLLESEEEDELEDDSDSLELFGSIASNSPGSKAFAGCVSWGIL